VNWKEALECQQDLGGDEFLIQEDSLSDWFPSAKTVLPEIEIKKEVKRSSPQSIVIPAALRKDPPKPKLNPESLGSTLEQLHSQLYQDSLYLDGDKHQSLLLGQGPGQSHLMIIGFAPTPEDMTLKSPFAGAGGELLRKMLQAIKIEKNLCYLTYFYKAAKVPRMMPRDKQRLLQYLKQEIELVKPQFILVLGSELMQICKVGTDLTQVELIPHQFCNVPTVATFDTSSLLQNNALKRTAWAQLQFLQGQMQT
jgi:uracil-DNA glycosylase family 4